MEKRRMDPEDRKEQILVAALQVFGEKGFSEASNKDIAQAAGLRSPALLYHYFPSKLDLLRSVAERFSPLRLITDNPERILTLPPEEGLRRIGEVYLSIYSNPQVRPLMKVVLGESLKNAEFAETFGQIGPLRLMSFVTVYMQRLMESGYLRSADPMAAARSFLGPFVAFFMVRLVFEYPVENPPDPGQVVEETVETFLNGMRRESV